jgi:3-hydroxybutyryl-CoA dehydrogenase
VIFEAVPEQIDLKRGALAQIGPHLGAQAWVASCTSAIPASWLADPFRGARRLVSMSFGGPDDLKVEIMGYAGTEPSALDAAERFTRSLGLVPFRVRREIFGYAGNRIWRAIQREALSLIDRGYATAEEIDRGFYTYPDPAYRRPGWLTGKGSR